MRFVRALLTIALIESLLLQQMTAQSAAATPATPVKTSTATGPVMLSQKQIIQTVDFAYYAEEDDMTSTLVLNNNGRGPVDVMISFFNHEGDLYQLPITTISNQAPSRFKIGQLLREAKGNFSTGNVQVTYQGRSMQVTGQMTISDEQRHLVFESRMAQPRKSRQLNGIVWFPTQDSQAMVAITNIAMHPISVHVSSAGSRAG